MPVTLIGIIVYAVLLLLLIRQTLMIFKPKYFKTLFCILALIFSLPLFSAFDITFRNNFIISKIAIGGYVVFAFNLYYLLLIIPLILIEAIVAKIRRVKIVIYDKLAVLAASALSIIVCIVGLVAAQYPKTDNYSLDIKGEHDLKLTVVADIHYGSTGSLLNLDRMVKSINATNPDVIIFVGDVFDNYVSKLDKDEFKKALESLKSTYGTLVVTGNHEFKYNTIEEIRSFYENINVKLLLDEQTVIDNIRFVGRVDKRHPRKDLNEYVDFDDERPLIVLDHQPQYYREAQDVKAQLQFSGHTHNGQLFPGNFLVKFYNLAIFKSPAIGINKFDDFTLAITRGYGTWGPPLRTTGSSQIMVYHLK